MVEKLEIAPPWCIARPLQRQTLLDIISMLANDNADCHVMALSKDKSPYPHIHPQRSVPRLQTGRTSRPNLAPWTLLYDRDTGVF